MKAPRPGGAPVVALLDRLGGRRARRSLEIEILTPRKARLVPRGWPRGIHFDVWLRRKRGPAGGRLLWVGFHAGAGEGTNRRAGRIVTPLFRRLRTLLPGLRIRRLPRGVIKADRAFEWFGDARGSDRRALREAERALRAFLRGLEPPLRRGGRAGARPPPI